MVYTQYKILTSMNEKIDLNMLLERKETTRKTPHSNWLKLIIADEFGAKLSKWLDSYWRPYLFDIVYTVHTLLLAKQNGGLSYKNLFSPYGGGEIQLFS